MCIEEVGAITDEIGVFEAAMEFWIVYLGRRGGR